MKFETVFGSGKPIMAMLHLKGDRNMDVLERAKREVRCYLEQGVEALIVENYFGSVSDCERVLEWLQKEYPQVCYGVNILGDYAYAFDLAEKYNARFIQIDSVCGHLPPVHDEWYARRLNQFRAHSDAVVLGGVRFKYQPVRSGRSVEEDLRLGMERCDAIVVTGEGTGMATPMEKVRRFRETLGDFPLILGAGVTPDSLQETVERCDGAIVGSYFKEGHRDIGEVCEQYVRELMDKKRQYTK